MKTQILFFGLFMFFGVLNVGCQDSGGSSSRRVSRGSRFAGQGLNNNLTGVSTGPSNACTQKSGSFSGSIYTDYGYGNEFTQVWAQVLEPFGMSQELGAVSAGCGQGVLFNGRVESSTPLQRQWGQQQTIAITSGSMEIAVIDSIAKQNPQLGPIRLDQQALGAPSVSGTISGDQAEVNFYWSGVSMALVGYIDKQSQVFYGEAGFASGGQSMILLGNFEVPMCDFFRCH